MLTEIYNQRILYFAGNIPRIGHLENAQASAKAVSRICGSTVTIDLIMKDGIVADFAHQVKACALGQASSSIMARNIIGSTSGELRELRNTVVKMLKQDGKPPGGKWHDIEILQPVKDFKARHASTLLTFDAVVKALDIYEKETN